MLRMKYRHCNTLPNEQKIERTRPDKLTVGEFTDFRLLVVLVVLLQKQS